MNKFLLITLFFASNISFGQELSSNIKDSVWIDFDLNNKLYIPHKVEKDQTLYSISRQHNISTSDLIAHNEIKDGIIGLEDLLQIPVNLSQIQLYCETDILRPKDSSYPIYYKVKHGDNLYHVAKRIFNVSPKCLANNNNLQTEILSLGQNLIIGYFGSNSNSTKKIDTVVEEKAEKRSLDSENTSMEDFFWSAGKGMTPKVTKGAASLMKGTENQPLLVLFNKVAKGELVRIYNKSSEKSCYARVVGTIPAKLSRQNIIIVTKLVQEELGLREDRFNVSVEYFR